MSRTAELIITTALLVGGAGLLVAAPADAPPADQEGDDEEAERDLDEAEKRQGQGQGPESMFENPLEKILELMEKVEGRLFDADTGDYTQEEQKKIVEAMRFEDKTSAALEELINKVEQQQQQQQQSSQQQKEQQQQQQQQETEEQRRQREREKMQREKEREKQRQAQRQQQQKKDEKDKQDRERREKQRREEGRPPEDGQGGLSDEDRAAGRWGTLPSKLHQDAANAAKHQAPGRWRELIERYRAKLADQD